VSATIGDLPNLPGTASLAALGAAVSEADYTMAGFSAWKRLLKPYTRFARFAGRQRTQSIFKGYSCRLRRYRSVAETLRDLHFIENASKSFGAEKVVVSIDIVENEILSTSESIKLYRPVLFAEALKKMGVAKVIILDLRRVGSEQGQT
jgi:hypothetical protein